MIESKINGKISKEKGLTSLWFYYLYVFITTEIRSRQKIKILNDINHSLQKQGVPAKLPQETATLIDASDPFCKEASRLSFTSDQDLTTYDLLWDKMPPSPNLNTLARRNELISIAEHARRQLVRSEAKELLDVTMKKLHLRPPLTNG